MLWVAVLAQRCLVHPPGAYEEKAESQRGRKKVLKGMVEWGMPVSPPLPCAGGSLTHKPGMRIPKKAALRKRGKNFTCNKE